MVQEGLAHLCLIGSATTIQKAKVEMSLPRKRGAAAAGYDTAYKNFLNRASLDSLHHMAQLFPMHEIFGLKVASRVKEFGRKCFAFGIADLPGEMWASDLAGLAIA